MSGTGNRLLDLLPTALSEAIISRSRHIDLPVRTPLSLAGEVPACLYLLTSGVASTVTVMAGGGSAEVGMAGTEGLVDAAALLGPVASPSETFMQIGGSGFRVPVKILRDLFGSNAEVRTLVLQYLQAHIAMTAQISACNRLHEAEPRLARWLLTAADLSHSDTVRVTQELLAQMLGSQRTTVALVAGGLQKLGLIHYSRGTICILDRRGLAASACACYEVTHKVLSHLYE